MKNRFLLTSILAGPVTLGMAQAAHAQDPGENEIIVVTGSYIGGQIENGPLPVDVFSQEELDQRGIDSPLEFIKTLPSVGPVLGDSNQYSAGGSQGVGSINLRSLGRERTLVLFNGRRFMSEPGDGAADTNLIPLFALERVEVLKDGAASTYGSDAIAGVANFVTRRNFEGVEISGDWQFVDGSDDNYQASILVGETFGDANFMIGFGYQHRSELPTTERDFTQVPYAVNPTGWSFLSNPGTYIPKLGPISQGPAGTSLGLGIDGNLLGACEALGGIDGVFPTGTSQFPVCRYSYIPFVNLIEEEDRYQVYGQMSVDLSDTLEFNAEGLWARTEVLDLAYSPSYPPTQGPRGPGSTQAFFIPRSNPGFNDFLAQTFPAGSPTAFSGYASALFFRPFALGGNPLDPRGAGQGAAVNDAFRFSGGFENEFSSNFRGQLYATYQRYERTAFSFDFVSSRLQQALSGFGGPDCTGSTPGQNGCSYFNPFINSAPGNPALGLTNPAYIPGNDNDPDLINWMRAENGTIAYEDQYIVDLIFDGSTNLLGLPFDYAFGGQYRNTRFVSRPINRFSDPQASPCPIEGDLSCLDDPNDNNFPVGAFTFLGNYPYADLTQDIYALFAEARIEPFLGFEIIGAIRYEDYGNPVGSTINPKISARWEVSPWLTFRGSIGDTFRGPLPSDLGTSGVSAVAGIDAAGGAFKATDSVGNPNLDPETALTYNLGAIVQFGDFTFSVDFWNYEFEGRFTDLPIQAIASAVAPGPVSDGTQPVDCNSPFVEFVVFQGGACTAATTANDISRIRTQVVNGPDVTTRGLDFGLTYRSNWGPIDVNIGANATHVLDYEFGDFMFNGLLFSTGYEAAGFTNYDRAPGTVSDWRANAFANFQYDPFSVTWNVTYISGADDNRCPATGACTQTPEFGPTDFGRRVGSFMTHDLIVRASLPVMGADFEISAGVENIFDEDPPAARLEYSYDPFIGTALGRTFRLGASVRF